MDLISIWSEKEKSYHRADELSARLKLPISRTRPKSTLCLYVDNDRIGLGFSRERPFRPYYVDFCSRAWRFRRRRGFRDNKLFLTAIGLKEGATLMDATAGFGQDAFLLGWAGAKVTALERSRIVCELLQDGLRRAFEDDSGWHHAEKISVVCSEALKFLETPQNQFDVIYLDPMFDKPKKKAKSPKPMQLLQTLLGPDPDETGELFELAVMRAKSRVVVKLPLKGVSPLPKANVTFAGQSIRYDVYLLSR